MHIVSSGKASQIVLYISVIVYFQKIEHMVMYIDEVFI